MAKSELTKQIELALWNSTNKMGIYKCCEVGIRGSNQYYGSGEGIVDFVTYDTKGIWKCYEIKVSKADFNSKCIHTFVGNYNYYVMTRELYEKVKNNISKGIGVFLLSDDTMYSVKKATCQKLGVSEEILKYSFMKSLSREFDKGMKKNYAKRLRSK